MRTMLQNLLVNFCTLLTIVCAAKNLYTTYYLVCIRHKCLYHQENRLPLPQITFFFQHNTSLLRMAVCLFWIAPHCSLPNICVYKRIGVEGNGEFAHKFERKTTA